MRAFRAWLRSLYRQPWVVYAKPPFGSPAHVLHYLARYTHRVAISNHRLVDVTDDTVSFRWKDYRHGSQVRTLTLAADEFLRRFLAARAAEALRPHPLLRLPRLAHSDAASSPNVVRRSPWRRRRHPNRLAPAAPRGHRGRARAVARPMRLVERLTARQLFLDALLADILHDTLVAEAHAPPGGPSSRSYARAPEVCPLAGAAARARRGHGRLAALVAVADQVPAARHTPDACGPHD